MEPIDLAAVSTEFLVSLKHAINQELRTRKHIEYVKRRLTSLHEVRRSQLSSSARSEILVSANRELLLALPADVRRMKITDRTKYLPCILNQDWTFLFPHANTTHMIYYVYAHIDPRKPAISLKALQVSIAGEPFYIGKGCDARAWDLSRNQGHGKRIGQIRQAGFPDSAIVQVIAENLSERDSLSLEAKLIYYFGSLYDEKAKGCLLNLADHMRPVFVETMPKLPGRKDIQRHSHD
jgi:hypothetical protein